MKPNFSKLRKNFSPASYLPKTQKSLKEKTETSPPPNSRTDLKQQSALDHVQRNSSTRRLNNLIADRDKALAFLTKSQIAIKRSEEQINAVYQQLASISRGTSSAIGEIFFNNLAQCPASAFNVRWAFVGRLIDSYHKKVHMAPLWDGKEFHNSIIYDLKHTPCENVVGKVTCFYPRKVQSLFPHDTMLKEYGIESYFGIPITSSSGKPLGVLAVMDNKPMERTENFETIMQIFGARCSSEIERFETELALIGKSIELEKSNQALKDFVSIASHDLQSPLRKIISFCSRLRSKGANFTPDSLGYLDRTQKVAWRMQELLSDLLLFSQVSAQTEPFQKANLKIILNDVLESLDTPLFEFKDNVEIGPLPKVEANVPQMRQLFQNLITNAFKFHKKGVPPHVTIEGRQKNQELWEISVRDQGIGLPEKHRDRIFRPFEKLHGNSEYEGTGMGLAICKKIVERHGGTITVESQPDHGACFIFTLRQSIPS